MRYRRTSRPDTTALRLIGPAAWLDDDQLRALARHTDVIDRPAGDVLCRAGDPARQLLTVLDGYVDITGPTGDTWAAGPGTQIGLAELVELRPFAYTAVTRTPVTLVVIFGPALRHLASSLPRPVTEPRIPASAA